MRKRNVKMRIGSMIFILLVFCAGQILAAPCGDTNSDGIINIVDALMIAQYYVGLNPGNFDAGAADVNGDGSINIVDALLVAQYYVGLINALPGCGGTPGPVTDGLIGWATTNGGTTGGGNATPQTVTSASALKNALSGDTPRVVLLSGTVDTGSDSITINSNKTLRGVDANARIVGGLSVRGNNVIVQNLTVQGKGQGKSPADAINSTGSSNIWFDHLNVLDGGDGIMDLTNGSDRATVSWCKFWYTDPKHSHRLALLFGNGSEKCDIDGGKQNHTIHHNWFADLVDQRMPRLLFGKGHIFNNYYNSPGNTYCIGVGSWGSVLVENNYFEDVNDPHRHQDGHPGYIVATGNIYDNTSGKREVGYQYNGETLSNCERALWDPGPWTPPYNYTLDPAADVPNIVKNNAGPR